MSFSAIFTLLVFIILNFSIIFIVKTRTTTVISLITSHLIALLFFALTISNYVFFKEVAISLIIYSMVVLFLISNHSNIHLINDGANQNKGEQRSKIFIFLVLLIAAIVIILLTNLVLNLEQSIQDIANSKVAQNVAIEDAVVVVKYQGVDNFLFRRSSDVILFIVAATSLLLLLLQKRKIKIKS